MFDVQLAIHNRRRAHMRREQARRRKSQNTIENGPIANLNPEHPATGLDIINGHANLPADPNPIAKDRISSPTRMVRTDKQPVSNTGHEMGYASGWHGGSGILAGLKRSFSVAGGPANNGDLSAKGGSWVSPPQTQNSVEEDVLPPIQLSEEPNPIKIETSRTPNPNLDLANNTELPDSPAGPGYKLSKYDQKWEIPPNAEILKDAPAGNPGLTNETSLFFQNDDSRMARGGIFRNNIYTENAPEVPFRSASISESLKNFKFW